MNGKEVNMSQQLFGVYILHPADVWSSKFEQIRAERETEPMMFFKAASAAFRYIERWGSGKGMPATITPIGENLQYFPKLPGVGIMYNVTASQDVVERLKRTTTGYEMPYEGNLSDMHILECQCVFPRDYLHDKGLKTVDVDQVQEELSNRYESYRLLEQTLSHTTEEVRRGISWHMVNASALESVYNENGMIRSGFTTPHPQDQSFVQIAKTLWESNAGFQYMERMQALFSTYRDVYARNIVSDISPEASQLRAAVAVLQQLETIANATKDTRMLDIFEAHSEDYAVAALQAEHNDIEQQEK
jgi:hypothetical protein